MQLTLVQLLELNDAYRQYLRERIYVYLKRRKHGDAAFTLSTTELFAVTILTSVLEANIDKAITAVIVYPTYIREIEFREIITNIKNRIGI